MKFLMILLFMLVHYSMSISIQEIDKQNETIKLQEEGYTLIDIANSFEQYHLFQVLGIETQDRQMKRIAVASILSILTIAGCCGCSQIIQAYSKSCKQKLPPPDNKFRRPDPYTDSL